MNKKTKIELIYLSLLVLAISLFISCDGQAVQSQENAPLAYITFTEDTSKAISITYSPASYSTLYWFYTAKKTDNTDNTNTGNYGTTGQTEGEAPVNPTSTTDKTPQPGLGSNTLGPFSQGKWKFTLTAYKEADKQTKIYSSDDITETLYGGETKTITVSVKAETSGEGTLALKDLYFTSTETISSATMTLTATESTDSAETKTYTLSASKKDETNDYSLAFASDAVTSLSSGTYKCVITAGNFTSTFNLLICTGGTTTLSGQLVQDTTGED